MRIIRSLTLLLVVSLACAGCDQGTKLAAEHFLEAGKTLSYMGDVFRLSYIENTGAFLGLGAGLPHVIRHAAFLVLEPLLLFGFSLYVLLNKKSNTLTVTGCALIIGGGIGNLIDRIVNQGAVIDFMNIGIGPLRTGIFNVADMAIMAGLLILGVMTNNKANAAGPRAVIGTPSSKGLHDHGKTH